MNLAQEIARGEQYVAGLPGVLNFALIGSALYLPDAEDVDYAVLLEADGNAFDYAAELTQDQGWSNCGEYDTSSAAAWCAIRRGHLNLMITHDPEFFQGYVRAMQVCKALHLIHKQDRIAVCQIVRDGMNAEDVVTHKQLSAHLEAPA